MQCKHNSYFLVSMLFLRGFLLLTFMTAACLYLAYFHLSAFLQDEFSCFVRTGMLRDQNWIPELVQCKMTGQLVFQVSEWFTNFSLAQHSTATPLRNTGIYKPDRNTAT